jgi:hypothetical protein
VQFLNTGSEAPAGHSPGASNFWRDHIIVMQGG